MTSESKSSKWVDRIIGFLSASGTAALIIFFYGQYFGSSANKAGPYVRTKVIEAIDQGHLTVKCEKSTKDVPDIKLSLCLNGASKEDVSTTVAQDGYRVAELYCDAENGNAIYDGGALVVLCEPPGD